jgi:hypothetical protein
MMKKPTTGSHEPHVKMAVAIWFAADVCRRENIALRSILHKQGLSDRAVQDRVKRILKNPEQDKTGAQLLQQVCEETIKRFRDHDAQAVLATVDPIGGVQ